ncbi:NAD-dependent epimerase/dehydratase family protein [Occultella glacieicola]|uniref:NAD-dependent epimerase/dehydratase family protein n=1 Tax=Occultella glacieicola TaxID=2518684 RepID=A0ABY2E876_9MICO|nr:NAD-dependent epimerase/dehydratase family protein [Occultella glacieicola]TDE98715.1 NAD-dependent epimerase/dehydratase family protein [Occultella glacieicola]
MRIVVTGGSGVLGTQVVHRARELGHQVVPASRRWGVDLSTGEGLGAVLAGADAVVHAAANPRRSRLVDVDGTVQLLAAIATMIVPAHLVYVSLVGCAASKAPYARTKRAVETMIEDSDLPATIVRSTRFHPSAAFLARAMVGARRGVSREPARPVDPAWVASELVSHAVGERPDGCVHAPDLAGPEMLTTDQLADAVLAHDGRAHRFLRMPGLGRARAFATVADLPGPGALLGGSSFGDWLGRQPLSVRR